MASGKMDLKTAIAYPESPTSRTTTGLNEFGQSQEFFRGVSSTSTQSFPDSGDFAGGDGLNARGGASSQDSELSAFAEEEELLFLEEARGTCQEGDESPLSSSETYRAFATALAQPPATGMRLLPLALLEQAVRAAVAVTQCVASVSDPKRDVVLVMVSSPFEAMSGYSRQECLGKSMCFLGRNCEVDPAELVKLRFAEVTGQATTACVVNRRKTGELFQHLIYVRGLTVGLHPTSGQEHWLLVAVHADITDFDDSESGMKAHTLQLERAAEKLRNQVNKHLNGIAMAARLHDRPGPGGSFKPGELLQSLPSCKWKEIKHEE